MKTSSNRMLDFWHSRWNSGKTGWHEADGNKALRKFWPRLPNGSGVLVPLCGKSPDLLWLAEQGCDVTGVELSEIAARAFFDEAGLSFETEDAGAFTWFVCPQPRISIACGNYFEFSDTLFDALYDRAALVALPPKKRPEYVHHTRKLLKPGAFQLLITLEYDQAGIEGPPFPVPASEVLAYWPSLERISEHNDIDNSPQKFREVGIKVVTEAVWVAKRA